MAGGEIREKTKLHHFERLLELTAFNVDGGLQKTSLIKSHLIDHFIPFLPLENRHVVKCIETEFKNRRKTAPEELIR